MLRAAACALALLAFAARADADADPAVDAAVVALRTDPSIKVRTQAALVLGQRGAAARAAVPALVDALERDAGAPVRLAVARALGRIGDAAARAPLDRARAADGDPAVRAAAASALAALSPAPREPRSFSLEEPRGRGDAAGRRAFKEAIARHLTERGFSLRESGGLTLKPSVVGVDVAVRDGRTTIAVKASLLAVEEGGRMAAMLESGARLSALGAIPDAKVAAYAARALDAAALTLCDDLAAKLAER
jgi:hypothetical protein